MSDDELTALYDHAKAVVNDLRRKAGKRALGRLRRGFPKNTACCVITESLADVGVASANYHRPASLVRLSGVGFRLIRNAELVRFMMAFDAGKYPDLIVKRKNDIKIDKQVVIPKG